MKWISVEENLPDCETPVLIILNGEINIGQILWEFPSYEETYTQFQYWDSPFDDGQDWEWEDITYWMELPKLPNLINIKE